MKVHWHARETTLLSKVICDLSSRSNHNLWSGTHAWPPLRQRQRSYALPSSAVPARSRARPSASATRGVSTPSLRNAAACALPSSVEITGRARVLSRAALRRAVHCLGPLPTFDPTSPRLLRPASIQASKPERPGRVEDSIRTSGHAVRPKEKSHPAGWLLDAPGVKGQLLFLVAGARFELATFGL
jgi:hypothetical protein